MAEAAPSDCPRIGLLNLMPAAALPKTEHQWRDGFGSLAEVVPVRFDDDPREQDCGSARFLDDHTPISDIADSLDGIIVTGANLERLPDGSPFPFSNIRYIGQLHDVIDWAEDETKLTVYSCLASHIALDHLFDVPRDILPEKVFGVYCHQVADSPLTEGIEAPFHSPHSRWGNVPTKLLRDAGVNVVAEGFEPGWLLASHERSGGTTVFVQGHPEYWRDDLAAEYRRDASNGQSVPENYFPYNNPASVPRYDWHDTRQQLFANLASVASHPQFISV